MQIHNVRTLEMIESSAGLLFGCLGKDTGKRVKESILLAGTTAEENRGEQI